MFEYTQKDVHNVEKLIESHARKLITDQVIGLSQEVVELIEEEVEELSSVDLDSCIKSPNNCIQYAEVISNNVINKLN